MKERPSVSVCQVERENYEENTTTNCPPQSTMSVNASSIFFFFIFLLSLIINHRTNADGTIRIGGLFSEIDGEEDQIFKYAASSVMINNGTVALEPISELVIGDDCLMASKAVCSMLRQGVAGVFGPQGDSAYHVQSICDQMDVPHLEARWDIGQLRQDHRVNLSPYPNTLAKVFADIVRAWDWNQFTILYENSDGLVRLNEVLKMFPPKSANIIIRQLELNSQSNYRGVLRRVRESKEKNIIIDCSIEILPTVLEQAQQIGLMIGQINYIITNLDFHTLDLEAYQFGGMNITGVRIVDPDDPDVKLAISRWASFEWTRGERELNVTSETIRMSTALIYDAVYLFAAALERLDIAMVEVTSLDCDSEDTWKHRSSLINFMKDVEVKGLTGKIQFDHEGFRSHFHLDIVEMSEDGLKTIGTWEPPKGLNLTRIYEQEVEESKRAIQNMTFVVLTAISKPYGMLKKSKQALAGNDVWEGYGMDLIKEISKILGFKYEFRLQPDGKNGALNKTTQEWDGMIRQILDEKADLAITDLSITAEREGAVDFTMPFMNLGISILYRKPTKEAPKLFSFLSTFSTGVWLCVFAAYIGVSLLLFIMGRISPYEWTNPYPCIEEPEALENQFNLKNSLWFTIGAFMQQGTEIAPVAVSTRMVAGIWWFFTLIMVSSYTANLAAVLTVENMSSPFKTAEDLASQNTIKYGAKIGGSTANFFRDSSNEVFQRMYEFMKANPSVMCTSNEEGQNKVKTENYAYLMESTSIDYITERDCEVVRIGGLLDNKGYGIAMRKNMWYRNSLSTAVLRLQESGMLTKLQTKWWRESGGGGACDVDSSTSEAAQLTLAHVGGVYLVLAVGVGVACIQSIFEFFYETICTARREKIPFRQVFMDELRFIARCRGTVKPVKKYHESKEPTEEGDSGGDRATPGTENRSTRSARLRGSTPGNGASQNGRYPEYTASRPYGFLPANSKEPLT